MAGEAVPAPQGEHESGEAHQQNASHDGEHPQVCLLYTSRCV
ncbi:hypothetical protein [Arthrobacter sp. KBS0703]|nr:hypothetical protein [Arthrobacter sp. KBS0703]